VASDPWAAWWSQTGVSGLRRVLLDEWDPLCVADVPEAQDEYDSYLDHLGGMLRKGAGRGEIQAYLEVVRTDFIGLPASFWEDQRAAGAIRHWWTRQPLTRVGPAEALTTANLAAAMCTSLPELVPDVQKLREESEDAGEPGVTLIAALLVPHTVDAAHADDGARLRMLSAFMERMAASADVGVRNALTVGMLEVVGDDRHALDRAREVMGPLTLALSIEIETFWGREPR
jgi:hypothetical protein